MLLFLIGTFGMSYFPLTFIRQLSYDVN